MFINTLHGQVYSQSPKFSIYPSVPSNYTAPGKSSLLLCLSIPSSCLLHISFSPNRDTLLVDLSEHLQPANTQTSQPLP